MEARNDPVKWQRYLACKRRWQRENRDGRQQIFTSEQLSRRRFTERLRYHRARGHWTIVNAMLANEVVVATPKPRQPRAPKKKLTFEDVLVLIPRDGTAHRASDVAKKLHTTSFAVLNLVKDSEIQTLVTRRCTYLFRK